MGSSDQPALVLEGRPGEAEIIALEPTTTLGRSPDSDVVVAEEWVSRRHAEIVETEDGYSLRDLGSSNGTYVNQERVSDGGYLLRDGDRIRLGASPRYFVFRDSMATALEPVVPGPAPVEEASPTPIHAPVEEATVEEVGAAGPISAPSLTRTIPLVPEADETPEAPTPALAGRLDWLSRLRGHRAPEPRQEAEAPLPAGDETLPVTVPPHVRLTRALRTAVGDIRLRLRRRTITVSVEDGVVRVAVFQGREVVAWGMAEPEVGNPYSDGPGTGQEDSETSRLRYLMEELRARRASHVTELPLYTPLVRHLTLPEIRRRYIEPVVISEVVGTIPFSADEVDIKWHLAKDGTEQHVTAVAVNKKAVDAHVERMRQSGVGPVATYSQAAALGLAAGVPDALVVHLGAKQDAVVLVRDGMSQAVHQVTSAKEEGGPSERAEAVARAVEQMEGYGETQAAGEEDQQLPVVLTGQKSGDSALVEELEQLLDHEVLTASPPVEYPEEFPVAEYASNVGLALLHAARRRRRRKEIGPGEGPVNLLSERHIPVPIPYTPVAVFLVLALFALSAFNITPSVDETASEAAAAAARLANTEDAARIHRIRRTGANKLISDAHEIRQMTLEMKARLEELHDDMESLGEWFGRIETITEKTRPEVVTISDLNPEGDMFTLSGSAPTLEDAIEYADNIRRSGLFINVSVREVTPAGGPAARQAPSLAGLGLPAGLAVPAPQLPAAPAAPSPDQEEAGGKLNFLIEATAKPSPDEASVAGEQDKSE